MRSMPRSRRARRSEEHTSELQSPDHLVCRLLLEKKTKVLGHVEHITTGCYVGTFHQAIGDRTPYLVFFFFNETATTEIYTLSLHAALPICTRRLGEMRWSSFVMVRARFTPNECANRKSTRLNSSHQIISYAVFCLKKK